MKRSIGIAAASLAALIALGCGGGAPHNPTPEPVSTSPSAHAPR